MKKWRGILAVCAAFLWWGMIYPQFTMVKGTYEIVREDDVPREETDAAKTGLDGGDIYWEIMGAERGQIRFRSRLLKEIRKYCFCQDRR